MRDVTGRRILIAIAATGSVLASCPAYAGAFGLRTQGTISLGQAFAGNASGAAGLSSMFWNPATITMRPGYTSEYNLSYVTPEAQDHRPCRRRRPFRSASPAISGRRRPSRRPTRRISFPTSSGSDWRMRHPSAASRSPIRSGPVRATPARRGSHLSASRPSWATGSATCCRSASDRRSSISRLG